MLNAQRLARIKEMVLETGFLSVRQLMDTFGISRSSAMRDLDELEKQGVVIRQRGGAVLKEQARMLTRTKEPFTAEKADIHEAGKYEAARKAAERVEDGECLFLDSGTTAAMMLPFLKDKDVTIVTPSTYLLRQADETFRCRIVLLGGDYDPAYEASTGLLARQILKAFWFDSAFVSANGLADGQAWSNDLGVAELKQEAMNRATHKILIADASKKELRGMYAFAPLDAFDQILIGGEAELEEAKSQPQPAEDKTNQ